MKLLKPTLILAALLPLAVFGALPLSVKADSLLFAMPPWEDGQGTPGHSSVATRRDMHDIDKSKCDLPIGTQLQALIPEEKLSEEVVPGISVGLTSNVWGRTISDAPLLWFSLNQSMPNATLEVEVETKEHLDGTVDRGNPIFYTKKNPSAGVFSVPMPKGSLTDANTNYYWKASIQSDCEATDSDRPETIANDGWIERVEVPEGATAAQNPQALATAYAESGIWFETLSTLAEMYRSNPSDPWVTTAWNSLMEAADLNIPITDLAEPEPNPSAQ